MEADALSRRSIEEDVDEHRKGTYLAITSVKPVWMTELIKSYEQDSQCQELIAKMILKPEYPD